MPKETKLKLKFQENMNKTGTYPVQKTINGKTEEVYFFFFSDEDLEEMRVYDKEKRNTEALQQNTPELH